MISSHLLALIPLILIFVLSLIWNRTGILHLVSLGYCGLLAFLALTNAWEVLFFPICLGFGIISLILFVICMFNGDWI